MYENTSFGGDNAASDDDVTAAAAADDYDATAAIADDDNTTAADADAATAADLHKPCHSPGNASECVKQPHND